MSVQYKQSDGIFTGVLIVGGAILVICSILVGWSNGYVWMPGIVIGAAMAVGGFLLSL